MNYAQAIINDLYEEGDRDFNFLAEFFGSVKVYNVKNAGTQFNKYDKSKDEQVEDVLKLIKFFIDDGAYEGFYMPDYGKPSETYKTFESFLNFLDKKRLDSPDYFESILGGDDFYTVGLIKIKTGAKAPKVTPEIEKIFLVDGIMPTL